MKMTTKSMLWLFFFIYFFWLLKDHFFLLFCCEFFRCLPKWHNLRRLLLVTKHFIVPRHQHSFLQNVQFLLIFRLLVPYLWSLASQAFQFQEFLRNKLILIAPFSVSPIDENVFLRVNCIKPFEGPCDSSWCNS